MDAAVQTGLSLRSRATPAAEPGPDLQQRLEEAGSMQDGGGMDYGEDYDYDAGACWTAIEVRQEQKAGVHILQQGLGCVDLTRHASLLALFSALSALCPVRHSRG